MEVPSAIGIVSVVLDLPPRVRRGIKRSVGGSFLSCRNFVNSSKYVPFPVGILERLEPFECQSKSVSRDSGCFAYSGLGKGRIVFIHDDVDVLILASHSVIYAEELSLQNS